MKEAYNPLPKIRSPCRRGRNSLYCGIYLVLHFYEKCSIVTLHLEVAQQNSVGMSFSIAALSV